MADELIRIFVGADRSQQLAIKVLEHSIKRHTTAPVEIIPLVDHPVPEPRDPRNRQRTGFSFSRFCIPELTGYRGKAIYMDADMLVFKDIRGLWNLPFDGAKVVIQKDIKHTDQTMNKENAPRVRKKQCAVMLIDCGRLDWSIQDIVRGLDEEQYNYDQLMSEICILDEKFVGYGVPFEWNSLEYYGVDTGLIHYTDMGTQPWVSTRNPNGWLWFDEVRLMLENGAIAWETLEREVELDHFRPSILRELRYGRRVPSFLRKGFNFWNATYDKACGFVPHKAVYEAKRLRERAQREYNSQLSGAARGVG